MDDKVSCMNQTISSHKRPLSDSPDADNILFKATVHAPAVLPVAKNVLTIDLEEWFHVTNFENCISRDNWHNLPRRIPLILPRLLDLLAEHGAHATFFVLGWVARHTPHLIRRICNEGHELASHGDEHRLITSLSPRDFREQLIRSRDILEQISGCRVVGHRAPTYSLRRGTWWAFPILLESGFKYDSSFFPFGSRQNAGTYGVRFPCVLQNGAANTLTEYPLSTMKFLGCNIPIAGGGFFRLFPYRFTRRAIQHLNQNGYPVIMYTHPWEIDPEQPRVHQASWLAKFRHYHRLDQTKVKLNQLLTDFRFGSIREVYWSAETQRYEIVPQD